MTIPDDIKHCFRQRAIDSNKYSVGTVAIIGGSSHYNHAPVIAGLGARAAGAGLVRLVVPDASRIAAGCLLPEATFVKLTPVCVAPRADVTAVGMGLTTSVNAQAIVSRLLSGNTGRFVIDADALTILSGWYGMNHGYEPIDGQELILTPHEGEAARLLGCEREAISAERENAAREIAARYHATVVLKGHRSITVSKDGKQTRINETGNPVMAMGGMGDLLSGMIAARWAYLKTGAFDAAASSVWLHGLAGDLVVERGLDPSLANFAAVAGSERMKLDNLR